MARYGGIDLGGTKIQAVVVDEAHEVLGSSRLPTPTTGGPADVTLAMIESINSRSRTRASRAASSLAVGVGSPGVVDDAAGTVTSARNLPDWEGTYPLGEKLGAAFDAPDRALQRRQRRHPWPSSTLGAAKPFRSILGVFWGTGVGGGLILDGELWEGRGGAGEIGHMVVKSDGRTCPCGRVGCMEAYAGRGAMETRAREKVADGEKTILFDIMEERGKPRLSSGIWQRALEKDDDMAHHMIDRAVGAIGVAVASTLNLLDVEAVVIGGGLGLRLGEPVRGEDPRRDDAAPVRRPPAARGAARLARRPRRGDRRDAARARQGARARLAPRGGDHPVQPRPELAPRDRRGALRPEVVGGARGRDERQPAVVGPGVAHDRLGVARVHDPVLRAAEHPQRDARGHRPGGRDADVDPAERRAPGTCSARARGTGSPARSAIAA